MKKSSSRRHPMKRATRKVEFCPVTFGHEGKTFTGFLVDLSTEGAKLRSSEPAAAESIASHDEIEMDVKTPYGPSSCKARVLWKERLDDGMRWGLKFTELPEDHDDPIHCLIESAFC